MDDLFRCLEFGDFRSLLVSAAYFPHRRLRPLLFPLLLVRERYYTPPKDLLELISQFDPDYVSLAESLLCLPLPEICFSALKRAALSPTISPSKDQKNFLHKGTERCMLSTSPGGHGRGAPETGDSSVTVSQPQGLLNSISEEKKNLSDHRVEAEGNASQESQQQATPAAPCASSVVSPQTSSSPRSGFSTSPIAHPVEPSSSACLSTWSTGRKGVPAALTALSPDLLVRSFTSDLYAVLCRGKTSPDFQEVWISLLPLLVSVLLFHISPESLNQVSKYAGKARSRCASLLRSPSVKGEHGDSGFSHRANVKRYRVHIASFRSAPFTTVSPSSVPSQETGGKEEKSGVELQAGNDQVEVGKQQDGEAEENALKESDTQKTLNSEKKEIDEVKGRDNSAIQPPGFLKTSKSKKGTLFQGAPSVPKTKRLRSSLLASSSHSVEGRHSTDIGASASSLSPTSEQLRSLLPSSSSLRTLPVLAFCFEILWTHWRTELRNSRQDKHRTADVTSPSGGVTKGEGGGGAGSRSFDGGDPAGEPGESARKAHFREMQQFGLQRGDILWDHDEHPQGGVNDRNSVEENDVFQETLHAAVFCTGTLERGLQVAESVVDSLLGLLSSAGQPRSSSRVVFSFCQKTFSSLRLISRPFAELLALKLSDSLCLPFAPRTPGPFVVLQLSAFTSVDQLHAAVCKRSLHIEALKTYLSLTVFARYLCRLPGTAALKAELLLFFFVLSYDHEEAQRKRLVQETRENLREQKRVAALEEGFQRKTSKALLMPHGPGTASTARPLAEEGSATEPAASSSSSICSLSFATAGSLTAGLGSGLPSSAVVSSATSSSSGFLKSRGSRSPPATEQPSAPSSPEQSRRNSVSSSRSFPSSVFFLGNGEFVLSSEKGFVAHVLLRFIEEELLGNPFSLSSLSSSAPFRACSTSSVVGSGLTHLTVSSTSSAAFSESSSVPLFSPLLDCPASTAKLHNLRRCNRTWGLLAVAEMIGLLPVQSLSLSLRRVFRLSLPYAVLWALRLTAFTSLAASHYCDVLRASFASSPALIAPTASSPTLPPRTTALVAACEAVAFGSFCCSSEQVGGYFSHTSLSAEGSSSGSVPAEVVADLRQNLALLLFDVDTQAVMRPANPLLVQKTLVQLLPFAAAYLPWLSDRLGNAMLFDFALGGLLETRDGDEEDEEVDGGAEEDGEEPEEEDSREWVRGGRVVAEQLGNGDGGGGTFTRVSDEDGARAGGGSQKKRRKAMDKLEKAFIQLVKGGRHTRARSRAQERAGGHPCTPEQIGDVAKETRDNAAGGGQPSLTTCRLLYFVFSFARHAVEASLVFSPALVTRCHAQIYGGGFHVLPYTALQRWLHCVEILTQMLQGLPPLNQGGAEGHPETHCWSDGTPAPCLTSPLDIPFIFGFLRAHSFPSEADFLGPSNASGVSSGFALRGSYRGVLFTDAAAGAPEGSLNQQARQWRREGAGVGLVLYLIAKLHSIPYFKARDATFLAKLHSALPWNGFLNFCSSDPLLGHWMLRFVHDALSASLPEVLSVNQPLVPDWRTRLDPSSISPLVLARANAVGGVRMNQLLSAFAADGNVANVWSHVRRTARLASSPSHLRTVGFRGGLLPSALEIFAFGCDNLWRFWADIVPDDFRSASTCFCSRGSAGAQGNEKCSRNHTGVSRYSNVSPSDDSPEAPPAEESTSAAPADTTAPQTGRGHATSVPESGNLLETSVLLPTSKSTQEETRCLAASASALEPSSSCKASCPSQNNFSAENAAGETPPRAKEKGYPQQLCTQTSSGDSSTAPVEAKQQAGKEDSTASQASSTHRVRACLESPRFGGETRRRDSCLLLETWHLMAAAEPVVATACVVIQLLSTFVHRCSVARKRHSRELNGEGPLLSNAKHSEKQLCVHEDMSLFFSSSLLPSEPRRKDRLEGPARCISTKKDFEGKGLPRLGDGDWNSAIAAHYFNVCQNPLNLLLRVPGIVLRRLMVLDILPECIYFLLLKMETYLSLGPPVVPDFPRIFFSPEDVLATQEAAVFQVLIEACRDAPGRRGPVPPTYFGRKPSTTYGIWEILCRLLDRQQARRPQALQLLFSGGFSSEAVNPICRFLSEPQRLLPLLTVALKETAGAIWKASEEAKQKQVDSQRRPVITSYERFVALPASPVSASVHPALPPLTAVDRCIFYLKAIVCVACDLRDNEALRSDDSDTNPAFAAESANAVLLEAVKHVGDHASEELCELVRRALPVAFPLYYLFPKLAVLVNAFLSRRSLLNGEAVVVSGDGGPEQQQMYTGGNSAGSPGNAGEPDIGPRAACEAMLEQLGEDLRLVVESDVQLRSSAAQQDEN
ncbi:hypothetical protein CSUI_004654 [Cystoisospora suis]|uniref:Uncharacterized protein n=1 Tax=Cystoisospora suis TaxID=483139 RepID=A0A2C6KM02_9APIC|nr:hypothetical protein CSUI_004654 [Cystoisospora suis]